MARKARVESGTGIYLIMLQAADQQALFREDADREKFKKLLRECREKCGFELYAYSLTRSAAFLLLREGAVPLSMIFKRLGSTYVYWYNVKYSRRGPLFKDRFRSLPAETDYDLKRMIRYVHYQPVKEGLSRDLLYPYSSWGDYLGVTDGGLADTEVPLKRFGREELRDYHETDGEEEFPSAARRAISVTEETAAEMLRQISRASGSEEFLRLPMQTQKECVIKAHLRGASIRQLSRLTGISKASVEKWLKDAPAPDNNHEDETPLFPFPFFPFFMSSGGGNK